MDKSGRSVEDADAGAVMGTACTRAGERMMAALGQLNGAASRFQLCRDVPFGGVLCAVGALLGNGLLSALEQSLGRIRGYYTATQVLLLLAFMGLCRIKTVDQAKQRLTVRVHRSARPAVDRTLEKLFENLNELETTFPSTERVMHYELLGSTDPKQKNGVNESSQR